MQNTNLFDKHVFDKRVGAAFTAALFYNALILKAFNSSQTWQNNSCRQ